MNFSRFILITVVTFLCSGLFSCNNDQWESLFNGEDLEGWTVKCLASDQGKMYWDVKDGSITCNSMGDGDHNYVWLATEREFTDFHLKLKFQVFRESDGNSGIQFRSTYDISDSANYGGWLNGPQVDIHGSAPFRTGLIYDETEGVRKWIHPSLPDFKNQIKYLRQRKQITFQNRRKTNDTHPVSGYAGVRPVMHEWGSF